MPLISLENIIQKSYHNVNNGRLREFCDKLSMLAGIILADIYELYELHKDHENVTELANFLEVKNPIKHIISILKKFIHGDMTIKDAVVDEIKIIKSQEMTIKTAFIRSSITLKMVIQEELDIVSKEHNRARNTEAIAQAIIDKLFGYKVEGMLNIDAENALSTPDLKTFLISILRRIKDGESIDNILLDHYKSSNCTRQATQQLDAILAQLKIDMSNIIQCEFDEVHNHLGGMGRQLYEATVGNVTPTAAPAPTRHHQHHHKPMVPSSRDTKQSVKTVPNAELFDL